MWIQAAIIVPLTVPSADDFYLWNCEWYRILQQFWFD